MKTVKSKQTNKAVVTKSLGGGRERERGDCVEHRAFQAEGTSV